MDERMEALCRTNDRLLPPNTEVLITSKCLDDPSLLHHTTSKIFKQDVDSHIGMPPSKQQSNQQQQQQQHNDDDAAITNNSNIQLAQNTLVILQQHDQPQEMTMCIRNVQSVLSNNTWEIPEEFISEMIHYLTLFYSVLQVGLRTAKPSQYYEQPRIYRQMEYFSCILWRMMTCSCGVYLFNQKAKILEEPMLESVDMDANNFWNTTAAKQNNYFVDCDVFVDALKTYLTNSGSFVKLDESLRQELMMYLDPGDSGIVTIFKFMPFANFFRPFRDCVSNMHQLRNCSWFRGYLSKEEASQILVLRDRGTFLLHFAGNYPDRLTLSHVPFELKGNHIDNIDRYSPLLLSVDGIRQKWFKQAQIPYDVDFSWNGAFFGLMSFEEAEELLAAQPVGTYLLRLSHSSPGWFVIAYVSQNRKVLQLKIAVLHQGFESAKKQFATLHQLVGSYASVLKSVSFLSKFQQDTRMVADKVKRILAEKTKFPSQ